LPRTITHGALASSGAAGAKKSACQVDQLSPQLGKPQLIGLYVQQPS